MITRTLPYIIAVIYYLFSTSVEAQNYYLHLKSSDNNEQKTLDSIHSKNTPLSISTLIEEYKNKIDYLYKNGYLYLESSVLEKTNDSIYTGNISLKQKYDKIHINTKEILTATKLQLNISQDTIILPIHQTEQFINSLLRELEQKGYPMSSVQLTNHRIEKNHLTASLNLKVDIKRSIDNIYITPYEKFPKAIKKQLVKRYQHKEYSQENINALQKEMQQFPFVKVNKPAEILFTDEQTILYVYADKTNASRFDGLVGFNSNEETGKLQFNGHLDLQLLNVFNAGEQLKLYWKNDGQQQSTLRIQTEVPYIFSSPFGFMGELQIFKQDSTMQNTKINLQALYYLSLQNRIGLGIQNTSSTAGSENTYGSENYSNTFFTANHYITTYQDHSLFPTKFKSHLQVGFGNRKTDTENLPQYFIQLYVEKLWQINQRNYLHQAIEAYYLKSDKYIYNELFRFGGNQSIRGFIENSLFAQSMLGLFNEYRYILSSTLYAHTLTDIGYYEDPLLNTQSILYSGGMGLGIKTGGGLFNMIYAVGKQPNQKFELKNAIVHISFKTQF